MNINEIPKIHNPETTDVILSENVSGININTTIAAFEL